VLFAHLYRAEGNIPLATLALACNGPDILKHDIRKRHNLLELGDNAGLGLPTTPGGGRYALFAVQAIIEAFGPPPLAKAPCPPHGPSRLHGIFNMIRCLYHEIEHRVFCANDAEAFKLTARIDTSHKLLIVWFLLVAELDIEDPQLIPLRFRFARFEQVTGFRGRARHECNPAGINDW